MYIQLNESDEIQGFTGFSNLDEQQLRETGLLFVEDTTLPAGFETEFWPGRWRYAGGAFSETGAPDPAMEQEAAAQAGIALAAQRVSAAEIVFVAMAQAGRLDDVTITEHPGLFAGWAVGVGYMAGTVVGAAGVLYRCAQAHTSQVDWAPAAAPALWMRIGDPAEKWPAWAQPLGAHDAYALGDRVRHGGKRWISAVDGNVWEPGTYGWEERNEDTD